MSLPTPPSGILDRDRPWYRGKISDAQWDRLKAKLTGGTDAGGTSYSKFIDCSAAEADKIISNLKKDPRGYPQMYMPGGGEAYQIMIDYFQWLKDSYLTDEPKEVEEIPVEVEVVEVEQKQPDEPIIVKIEAPFEPTPTQPLSAPKTLRLPRRKGVIRPTKAKKKSTAERMAEAFDERLDDLVDSIQNPPEAAQPKQRKQKESLVKIRKVIKPAKYKSNFKEQKGPKPFENLTAFLGGKVKNAFGRGADARRMAQEQGLPEQEKGFYTKRALGFEFGGDAIARTRGTFSKSPDATLDPSLSKQQRYTEGLFGTRTIRTPRGDKDLDKKFNDLEKAFDKVIDTKKDVPSSESTLVEFNKTVAEIRKALEAGNSLQKGINETKKEQAEVAADAANHQEMSGEEASLEQQEKNNGLFGSIKGEKKGKGKDGGGFDLGDMFDKFRKIKWAKWLRRLKNPLKFGRALFRLGRMKVGGAIKGAKALGAKVVGGAKGLVAGGAAATAAIVAGAGLAASGIGEGFFQLTKKGGTGDQVRDFFKKKGEETGGPMGAIYGAIGNVAGFSTEATKVTGNALDAIGAPFRYAIEGIRYPFLNEEDREKQADNLAKFDARIREYSRGWMNRIDFMNVVPDEKGGFGNIYGKDDPQKEMMEKMSEGGTIPEPKFQGIGGARLTGELPSSGTKAMVGEAGPELVATPGFNPLQSLAPMIVSMREITKRAGTWADPIENMVAQITDPIAKQLNLPVLPTNVDIGQGSISQMPMEEPAATGGIEGIFDVIKKLFGGGQTPGVNPVSGGYMSASLSGSAAQLIGNDTEFLAEVRRVAQKFGAKEGDLLGLMASESGFDPAADNGTHVGLIQFSRDSARTVGTTQAALKAMSRAEQMKYVEKYFQHWKDAGYFPDNPTAGQLYSVVFAPAYANKQDHEALYSAGTAAYSSNRPLDTNNDGKITMAEMGQRIERKKQSYGITDTGVVPSTPPTTTAPPPSVPAPPAPTPPPPLSSILPMPGLNPTPVPQQPMSAFSLPSPNNGTQLTSLESLWLTRLAQ